MDKEEDSHAEALLVKNEDDEPQRPIEQFPDENNDDNGVVDTEDEGSVAEEESNPQGGRNRFKISKRKVKRGVKATLYMLQGSWLPLLTDKIHNNVRSRFVMAFVYLFIAALVMALIVLTVWTPKTPSYHMEWVISPPPSFEFGCAVAPISLKVFDEQKKPVVGLSIYLSFAMLSQIDVNVSAPGEEGYSHSVDCVMNRLFQEGLFTDEPLCNNQWSKINTTTNEKGVATFSSSSVPMLIAYGTPGEFLVVAAPDDNFAPLRNKYITSVTEGKATVFNATISSNFTWEDTINRNTGIITFNTAQDAQYAFHATATWRSSCVPQYIAGGLIPINLLGPVVSPLPRYVRYTTSQANRGRSYVLMSGNLLLATTIRNKRDDIYEGTFHFNNVSFLGSDSNEVFLGFNFLGHTIPIIVTAFDSPHQSPKQVILPYSFHSHVRAVEVDQPSRFNVTEGTPFKVTVRVRDEQGAPMSGKYVFLRSIATGNANPTSLYGEAALHPGVWGKKLLFAEKPTDERGVAEFTTTTFSVSGGIGRYTLTAVCDGVEGSWAATSSVHPAKAREAIVNVVSSVDFKAIGQCPSTDLSCLDRSTVVLGVPWQYTPKVQVKNKEGIPITGKKAALLPINVSDTAVSAVSLSSDEHGWIRFDTVITTFAVREGYHEYRVVIDGQTVDHATRRVQYPPNHESLLGKCANVRLLDIPTLQYAGKKANYSLQTVDITGRPAPFGHVIIILPSAIIPKAPGANFSFNYLPTDENALWTNLTTTTGIAASYTLGVQMMCGDGPWGFNRAMSSDAALPYLPRLISMQNIPNTGGVEVVDGSLISWVELAIDVEWSAVDESNPLLISAEVGWQPECMTIFGEPEVPVSLITEPQPTVRLQVNYSTPRNKRFAGVYLFFLSADKALLPPPQMMHITPPVAEVQLLEGGWNASEVVPGVPFKHTPRVRVLDAAGNPQEHIMLAAQLGQVYPNGTCCRWLFPNMHPDDLVVASLGITGEAMAKHGNGYPVALPTNASGETSFFGLYVAGTTGSVTLGLRYCVVDNLMINMSYPDVVQSICVQEPEFISIPSWGGSLSTVSPLLVATVPGESIPDLTIVNLQGNKKPNAVSVCNAEQVSPPPVYLRKEANLKPQDPSTLSRQGIAQFLDDQFFYALTSTIKVTNLFYFATDTPDGDYKIRFRCIGAVTQDVVVQITSQVQALSTILAPPPRLILGNTYRFSVRVASVGNRPLAGVNVGLQQLTEDSCVEAECGILSPASITFAETNAEGTAIFSLAFTAAAASSNHTLKAIVVPRVSDTAVRQQCSAYYIRLSRGLGASGKYLDDIMQNTGADRDQQEFIAEAVKVIRTLADTASVSVGSSSQTTFGSFVERVKEVAHNPLGSSQSVSKAIVPSAKAEVEIENPVGPGQIHVIKQPSFEAVFKTLSIVTQFTGHVWYYPESSEVPAIKVVKHDSTPMGGAVVTCTVLPSGSGGVVELQNVVTNSAGELHLTGMRVYAPTEGEYSLFFDVNGGGGVETDTFMIRHGQAVTMKELLMGVAFALVFVLSPVLLASVPHTNSAWLVISTLVTLLIFSGFVTLLVYQKEYFHFVQNTFVFYFYEWFILLITFCLAASVTCMSAAAILSRNVGIKKFRIFDDEKKSQEMFSYTKWLLDVRVDTQLRPIENGLIQRIKNALNPVATTLNEGVQSGIDKINEQLDEEVFTPTRTTTSRRLKRKKVDDRQLWYDPKVKDAVYIPINYIIVASILVVLFCFITLFMYYVYDKLILLIDKWISMLPQPSSDTGMSIEEANEVFMLAITNAINLIVALIPKYSFLSSWLSTLSTVNFVGFLSSVASFLESAKIILTICFSIGTFFASVAIIITAVLFAKAIPKDIRAIRRGNLDVQGITAGPSEGYIGLHCMHFLMLHQLVFWPVVLLAFLLLVPSIRKFLWNTLSVLIITSVGSTVTQIIVQKVFVAWYLCDGFFVVRPEAYSIWHFFGFILGIFSGIAKTITRYVQSIVFVTILFARIDQSVFPNAFKSMDAATKGYNSMVVVEAKNGNPHFQLFAAWMLLEYSLKRFASTPLQVDDYSVAYDATEENEAAFGTLNEDEPLAALSTSMVEMEERVPPPCDESLHIVQTEDNYEPAAKPKKTSSAANVKTSFAKGDLPTLIDVDRFAFSKFVPVPNPGIRNLMALALRMMVCKRYTGFNELLCRRTERFVSLEPFADVSRRAAQERVRNKWWLLWMLHKNPSLRQWRKHALYVNDEDLQKEEDDALAAAGNVEWDDEEEEENCNAN